VKSDQKSCFTKNSKSLHLYKKKLCIFSTFKVSIICCNVQKHRVDTAGICSCRNWAVNTKHACTSAANFDRYYLSNKMAKGHLVCAATSRSLWRRWKRIDFCRGWTSKEIDALCCSKSHYCTPVVYYPSGQISVADQLQSYFFLFSIVDTQWSANMQPEQINFCQTGKSYKVVIAKQCFEKLIKSLIRKVRFAKNNEAKKYKKTFYLTTINVCINYIHHCFGDPR
jgi:hypothetical protein